jgi:hypothetical protein
MNITPEISYVTGFIIGDGNLSKSSYLIRAVEENEEFIRIFAEIFEKASANVLKSILTSSTILL